MHLLCAWYWYISHSQHAAAPLPALWMRSVLTPPRSRQPGSQGAAHLGREGHLCWLSPLIILRNASSVTSAFPHPGGNSASQGNGELEPCPKGRNVVIREVENRTEPKESVFDCALLFLRL